MLRCIIWFVCKKTLLLISATTLIYNEYFGIFYNILLDAWNTLEYSIPRIFYSILGIFQDKILKSNSLKCLPYSIMNTLEYSSVSLEYSKASLDIKILKSLSLYCLIIERETYTDS